MPPVKSVVSRPAIKFAAILTAPASFRFSTVSIRSPTVCWASMSRFGVEHERAAASASFVVIFASLSGFLAHVQVAQMDTALLATTAVMTASGAVLGAWLATEKLRAQQLKQIIALVLILVAIKTVIDLW